MNEERIGEENERMGEEEIGGEYWKRGWE